MFNSPEEFKRFVQELGFQEPAAPLKRLIDETVEVRRTMAYAAISSIPASLDSTRGTIVIREMVAWFEYGTVAPAIREQVLSRYSAMGGGFCLLQRPLMPRCYAELTSL